jgi:tRNA 2-thiouridine synthesizing protein A
MPSDNQSLSEWDAGMMGCGELILELKLRLARLPPGATLTLIARDPGVPEDLPAWCRMTGHRLLRTEPPEFVIERRAES